MSRLFSPFFFHIQSFCETDIPLPTPEGRKKLIQIALKSVKLADDVNIELLAPRLEGYSGADITNVCRDAAFMAARKKIKGLTAEAIKQMQKEEMDLPVTNADFEEAISKIQPSVNKADIEKYEKWMSEFGST